MNLPLAPDVTARFHRMADQPHDALGDAPGIAACAPRAVLIAKRPVSVVMLRRTDRTRWRQTHWSVLAVIPHAVDMPRQLHDWLAAHRPPRPAQGHGGPRRRPWH